MLQKGQVFYIVFSIIFSISFVDTKNSYSEEIWTYKQYEDFFTKRPLKEAYKLYMLGKIPKVNIPLIDAHEFALEEGIKTNSKWYKEIKNRLKKEQEITKNMQVNKDILFQISSKEKNFDMNFVNKKPVTPKKEGQRKVRTDKEKKEFLRKMAKSFSDFYIAPSIKICKESSKETFKNPVAKRIKTKKDDDIYFDSLLLSQNVLNKIKKESIINKDFFGNKNNIQFYENKAFDQFSYSLRKKDIKCLPVRVIVTKNFITKYYGIDALKNYDFKKDGELHWKVKHNLNKFLLKD